MPCRCWRLGIWARGQRESLYTYQMQLTARDPKMHMHCPWEQQNPFPSDFAADLLVDCLPVWDLDLGAENVLQGKPCLCQQLDWLATRS